MATPVYVTPEFDPDIDLKIERMTGWHLDPEHPKMLTMTVQLTRKLDEFEVIQTRKVLAELARTGSAISGVDFDFADGQITFDQFQANQAGNIVATWNDRLGEIVTAGTVRREQFAEARDAAEAELIKVFPHQA